MHVRTYSEFYAGEVGILFIVDLKGHCHKMFVKCEKPKEMF